jgi:hypothetical protein
MLKEQIEKYVRSGQEGKGVILFQEEKEYLEKHQFDVHTYVLKESDKRFSDAYIERCDKESENLIANESDSFLKQPLSFLKKNKNEFIYIESNWFDLIGVDAVSLEVDDVFGTYDVMLGLKLQKKLDKKLREYLADELQSEDELKFDLMFNGDEGIWSLNFALNNAEGFKEEMSIGEAYQLIYHFLFKLVEAVEA